MSLFVYLSCLSLSQNLLSLSISLCLLLSLSPNAFLCFSPSLSLLLSLHLFHLSFCLFPSLCLSLHIILPLTPSLSVSLHLSLSLFISLPVSPYLFLLVRFPVCTLTGLSVHTHVPATGRYCQICSHRAFLTETEISHFLFTLIIYFYSVSCVSFLLPHLYPFATFNHVRHPLLSMTCSPHGLLRRC